MNATLDSSNRSIAITTTPDQGKPNQIPATTTNLITMKLLKTRKQMNPNVLLARPHFWNIIMFTKISQILIELLNPISMRSARHQC